MALNTNESGFSLEEKFKKFGNKPGGQDDTHNHTHNDTQEPEARERKDRRVQLLTYGSLVDRMDAYAKRRGVSRAEVFEAAVTDFLDRVEG